jgi:hypothetical protein
MICKTMIGKTTIPKRVVSKSFLSAARVCLFAVSFALIAFASSETPHCSRVPASNLVAPGTQSDDPATRSGPEQFKPVADACSDSIAGCADPVKHIGTQNGCACFACGYGTPNQHSICTRDAKDKDTLFRRAR